MSGRSNSLRVWLPAALLIWLVLSTTFARFLAEGTPGNALFVNPASPTARLNLADEIISAPFRNKSAGENEAIGSASATLASPTVAPATPADDGKSAAKKGEGDLDGRDLTVPLARMASQLLEQSADGIAKGKSKPSGDAMTPPAALLTPDARKDVKELAEAALRNEPMSARALRLLGQISEVGGDPTSTEKLMLAARRNSLRESPAIIWLLFNAEVNRNYEAEAYYTDILFRTRGEATAFATWKLAQLAESAEANKEVKALLAVRPPWRARFLVDVPAYITDARTPLDLLLSLNGTQAPPTAQEIKSYLNFLIGKNMFDLAYYSWLQFLPPDDLSTVGLLANGSFEKPLSQMPFDWSFAKGSGVTIDIQPRGDAVEGHALSVAFGDGRVNFDGIRQLTMLGAGSYKLAGTYSGRLQGRRGLVWRVSCAKTGLQLAETPMLQDSGQKWKNFEVGFVVPDKDCRAQKVELLLDARSTSETIVSGRAEFDDISIARKPL